MDKTIWVRKAPLCFCGTLLFAAFMSSIVMASEAPAAPVEGSAAVLARLKGLLKAKRENEKSQADIWPLDAARSLSDAPPPPPILMLREAHHKIQREVDAALKELKRSSAEDPSPLLEAVRSGSEDVDSLEAIVPLMLDVCRGDPKVELTLIETAKGLSPCPPFLARALAQLDSAEASIFLYERGIQGKSLLFLSASAARGDAASFERLINLAEGDDRDLAGLALRAIQRLEPKNQREASARPGNSDERAEQQLRNVSPELRPLVKQSMEDSRVRELQDLVRAHTVRTTGLELKAALITYLGLFRDRANSEFLRSRYEEAKEDAIRLAVISALGRISDSGQFLLQEAENPTRSLGVRRASIQALAAVRHLAAVPFLLDQIEQRDYTMECARALEKLSGKKLGRGKAEWCRWWRTQPQSAEGESDPDFLAVKKG